MSRLHRAGARPVRNASLFFGACPGDPRFRTAAENLVGVIEGSRETLESNALLTAAAFDAGLEDLRRWAELPDAALWYSIDWAEGRAEPVRG